jgi:hypothetical protein
MILSTLVIKLFVKELALLGTEELTDGLVVVL